MATKTETVGEWERETNTHDNGTVDTMHTMKTVIYVARYTRPEIDIPMNSCSFETAALAWDAIFDANNTLPYNSQVIKMTTTEVVFKVEDIITF